MRLTRRVAVLLALAPAAARAQSAGSTLFVPDAGPRSTAAGRSLDRPRDPQSWGISDEQWEQFRTFAIASKVRLHVVVRLNSLRSRQFKEDLTELLASIPGWDVEDQGIYTAGTLESFDGILIQNRSAVEPTSDAQFLKTALDAAGIKPEAQFDATEPHSIRIVVGAPPEN